MIFYLLIIAMSLLFLGHYFKVLRWKQIIEVYEEPNDKNLFRSLSVGYLVNFLMPFRAGDLVRGLLAGRKMKNGFSFSISSIIVDRYLDVIVVGLIFFILSICGFSSEEIVESTKFYCGSAIILILLAAVAIRFSKFIKKIIKAICAVFNSKIQLRLLFFGWAVITAFKDTFKRVSKRKLFIYTLCMWAGYLTSYYTMAVFITKLGLKFSILDIFTMLFSRGNLDVASVQMTKSLTVIGLPIQSILGIYLIFPLITLILFSFCKKNKSNIGESIEKKLNLLPQINETDRLNFLENYFTGERRESLNKYLEVNRDINIIQDYSAGSNATTMLCMNNKQTFYRKYAFGSDGNKLAEQVVWLKEHEKDLPLPVILSEQSEDGYCCYDMEYNASIVDLFCFMHSMPLDRSWDILQQALETFQDNLYQRTARPLDTRKLEEYINQKVTTNVKKIENAKETKSLMDYEDIIINGVTYKNLPQLKKYLEYEHLYSVFNYDICADIHGDFTIENVICYSSPVEGKTFYYIDPNTGNVHDSPNLDYGKLLQSLHGGYEFLMKTQAVRVEGNKIDFLFTKSYTYNEIFWKYKAYMEENFTREKVKSIFYHEVVHWLRLMPYKIEKNGKRAILFYAGLIMVFNDVVKWFEEEKGEKE
ncbi:MAG: lysylphosphatidylglycerol synthase transmembrane domain-containing protein [Lachnospiraceae bacterium]|nr:lysylphosphatidylglycerol synthase transmembrane domain-containing protein [Lachnospiraceae bacterium]